MKIALLTEIPAPYRIPLFNALATTDGVELEVLFLAERDPRRQYPVYEHEFLFRRRVLSGSGLVARGRWVVFSRGTRRELDRFDPDIVLLGGWNQPAFWTGLREAADVQERAVLAAVPVDLDAEDREIDRVRRDDDAVAPDAERLDVLSRRAARHEEGGRRRDRAPLQPLEQRVPAALVPRRALHPEHDGTAAASGPAQAGPERGLVPAAEDDDVGVEPVELTARSAAEHDPAPPRHEPAA